MSVDSQFLTLEQLSNILAGDIELRRRARAVIDARYKKDGDWDELKNAIAALADLVGGGEIDGR